MKLKVEAEIKIQEEKQRLDTLERAARIAADALERQARIDAEKADREERLKAEKVDREERLKAEEKNTKIWEMMLALVQRTQK